MKPPAFNLHVFPTTTLFVTEWTYSYLKTQDLPDRNRILHTCIIATTRKLWPQPTACCKNIYKTMDANRGPYVHTHFHELCGMFAFFWPRGPFLTKDTQGRHTSNQCQIEYFN